MKNISAVNYILLGQRIKQCRLKQKMTYKDLSDLCNISTKTLQNIESANSKISTANLVNLSNALNVSIDYLLADSLKNKSAAVRFKMGELLEHLSQKERNVITETGMLMNHQLQKYHTLK